MPISICSSKKPISHWPEVGRQLGRFSDGVRELAYGVALAGEALMLCDHSGEVAVLLPATAYRGLVGRPAVRRAPAATVTTFPLPTPGYAALAPQEREGRLWELVDVVGVVWCDTDADRLCCWIYHRNTVLGS